LPVVEPEEPEALPVTLPTNETAVMYLSIVMLHTKSLRDWSSDVFSSDLPKSAAAACSFGAVMAPAATSAARMVLFRIMVEVTLRSEERRVGKECGSGWSLFELKTKVTTPKMGRAQVNSREEPTLR